MDFTQAPTVFISGVKNEALFIFFPSGLLSLLFGGLALKYLSGGYSLSLAGSLCLIGLIFFIY